MFAAVFFALAVVGAVVYLVVDTLRHIVEVTEQTTANGEPSAP